jgi:hypothetical protein
MLRADRKLIPNIALSVMATAVAEAEKQVPS